MRNMIRSRTLRVCSALLAGVMLCLSVSGMPAIAPTAQAANISVDDLQNQMDAYEQKLKEDRAALEVMKKNTADAQKRKQNLESQIDTLKSQIGVLLESIATVQNDVAITMEDIRLKEESIAQRRENYKERMAAMQELHDAGAMAMLANVKNLYQLLTFPEVLQDIADKDTQILDALRTEKAELEDKKAELEALQAELEQQKQAMDKKRDELGVALTAAGRSLEEAAAAQQEVQEMVESDELNYAALQKQIEALINSSAGDHADLIFNGSFSCPMKSGTFHVSSPFGYRIWKGQKKFHAGLDMGTWGKVGVPIYAAADGYVSAAEFNNGGYGNYVLLYHGKMPDGNSYSTLYAHMQYTPSVAKGQYVTRGTLLGYVGLTGRTNGAHLHLELWQGSTAANSVANKATRIDPASRIPVG